MQRMKWTMKWIAWRYWKFFVFSVAVPVDLYSVDLDVGGLINWNDSKYSNSELVEKYYPPDSLCLFVIGHGLKSTAKSQGTE